MSFRFIIENIYDQYSNAWNRRDIESMMKSFSENASIELPSNEITSDEYTVTKLTGKEKIQGYYQQFFNSQAYFTTEKIDIITRNKLVTVRERIVGSSRLIKKTFRLNEYGKLEYMHIKFYQKELGSFSLFKFS
ncbi:MAG: nuclear transport factor 2 family protein [Chitinophagaceae bacterium]|nr:nuclear transport factor 2 family protein [Chitinophagaceae bacterium]